MPRATRERRVAYALAAGATLSALVHDPAAEAAQSKRVALLVAAIAALALSTAAVARRPAARVAAGPAVLAWIAFVLGSAFSLAWGVPSGAGKLAAWVGATGLLAAGLLLPVDEARGAARLAGLSVGGLSALLAIVQYEAGARGLGVHGGAGNPNWLGLILAVALPLSVEQAQRGASSRVKLGSWLVIALELAALALSHSRVAWAAAAIVAVAWPLAAPGSRRRRLGAAALVAALVVSGAALLSRDAQPVELHAHGDGVDAPPRDPEAPADAPILAALEGRVWIWRGAAASAARALPLGRGLGGFAHGFLEEQGRMLAPLEPKVASRRFVNATTAHDDWLEVAVESGPVALALLVAAVALAAAGALRDRWLGGAFSLVAFAVCAAGDSPLEQPGAVVLLALTLAGAPRAQPLSRRASVVLLASTLLASAVLLQLSTAAWLASRRVTAAGGALPAARVAALAAASRLDPRSGEAALALGLARAEVGDPAGAVADLARSRPLLADVGALVAIGNAEMDRGAPDRANTAYAAALALHPGSFRAHANGALALAALGRFDEADAHLAVARSLWPGHPKLPALAEAIRLARLHGEVTQ